MIEAVILVGGKGTRLKAVSGDTPKPLVEVSGRPFLYWILKNLKRQGIEKVVLAAGYRSEKFDGFIMEYSKLLGLDIYLSVESTPLGTGGGVLNALHLIENDDFLVLNGDSICLFDVKDIVTSYHSSQENICCVTCFVEDVSRYGALEVVDNKIAAFKEKSGVGAGLINTGVYLLNKKVFSSFSIGSNFSFEKEILEKNINHIKSFSLNSYFIDIGIPEDFNKANVDFSNDILFLSEER